MSQLIGRGRNARETYPTSPGAAGFGKGLPGAYVIYRQGGVTSGYVQATWAGTLAAIAAGAKDVYVDSSLAPDGVAHTGGGGAGSGNFQGLAQLFPFIQGESAEDNFLNQLTIDDGDTLTDVRGIDGYLQVNTVGATTPALAFTQPVAYFPLTNNAALLPVNGSTVPAIVMTQADQLVQIFMQASCMLGNASGAPVVAMSSAGQIVEVNAFLQATVATNVVRGGAGTIFIFEWDSTVTPPAFTGFTGTLLEFAQSNAANQKYTAATIANWSGTNPTSVANALDRLAAHTGPVP
jgi:hypothetical protein